MTGVLDLFLDVDEPASASAARRAAVAAALAQHAHGDCQALARDAAFIDGFYSLSIASERQKVDDAALAAAAAEGDPMSAMLAQVLLAARRYAPRSAANERENVVEHSGMPHERAAAAMLDLLEAAIADDDESVVRWLASPGVGLDIAQVRAAQIACHGSPLLSALAQSLNSFRGREARDRAMRASRRLRAVSTVLAEEGATIATVVRAAVAAMSSIQGNSDTVESGATGELEIAAAESDRVWEHCMRPPAVRERVRLFLDTLARADAANATWPAANPSFMPGSFDRSASPRRGSVIPDDDGRQPWEWPAAEVARTVIAPPMTFSASRLNAFVKCGRQWFFEYLCDAVDDRGSIHATYGKAVHQALEALHRDIREPAAVEPQVLADRFAREIDAAFGSMRPDFASQFEYEVSRLQARRAAPKYVEWLVKQAAAAPMEIVEVESINRLHAGGHDFIGYIDRIDRPAGGGAVTIFDYKTGRVPEDLRAYLESVRTGEEAQLALYYFMRRARGDEVARVALVSIRDIHDDVRVIALDIVEEGAERPPLRAGTAACSRATLDASLAALIRRCDLLTRDGMMHFGVGADPPCRYCAYLTACRERPPDRESIFVR